MLCTPHAQSPMPYPAFCWSLAPASCWACRRLMTGVAALGDPDADAICLCEPFAAESPGSSWVPRPPSITRRSYARCVSSEAVRDDERSAPLHGTSTAACTSASIGSGEVASSSSSTRGSARSARDRDALLLPAAQCHAALAHQRRVPFREAANKVVSVGGSCAECAASRLTGSTHP